MTAARRTHRPGPPGWRVTAAAAAALLGLAGCSAPVQVHGNLPKEEDVAKIEAGKHGRNDVIELLGSPSAISTFKDNTWYYVGSKKTQFAFFKPEVLERNILAVSFDGGDTVASTETYTLKDGRVIDPVDRITPSEGKELTLLQQLLGNLGRFNPESTGLEAGTGGPGAPTPGQP